MLMGDPAAWVALAKESFTWSSNSRFRRKTRKNWTIAKAWLLDGKLQVSSSPFLRDLLKGFNRARISLYCETNRVAHPSHLIVEQLLLLFYGDDFLTPQQIHNLLGIFRMNRVCILVDLRDRDNGQRDVASFRRIMRVSQHGDDLGLTWFLNLVNRLAQPDVEIKLQDDLYWFWRVGSKDLRGWSLRNCTWRIIITPHRMDYAKFNRRWEV